MLEIHPVPGLPEVAAGDDLAALVAAAVPDLRDGDVLVVASKVVAKAEGRTVEAASRDGAVTAQTVRVVAERRTPRGTSRIVESRSGPVLAAAGVDASNVAVGTVLLLPADPDASARALRAGIAARTGRRVGVVVTDTLGRPWREGQVDAAIGAAAVAVTDDLRGGKDGYGNPLEVTVRALADEVAAAADLVKGKLDGVPVALVRGLGHLVTDDDGPGAATLLRAPAGDWFRLGHVEAVRSALGAPPAHDVEPPHVAGEDVLARARRAVRLAQRHRLAAGGQVAVDVVAETEPDGSTDAVVTLRSDDRFALGAVTERVGVAAWAEDLAAGLVESGPRHVVLRLEPRA